MKLKGSWETNFYTHMCVNVNKTSTTYQPHWLVIQKVDHQPKKWIILLNIGSLKGSTALFHILG